MAGINIIRTAHGGANYAVYKGADLFATIHGEKPNKANNRTAQWSLCYMNGRVEWFDTLSQAKDYAMKG